MSFNIDYTQLTNDFSSAKVSLNNDIIIWHARAVTTPGPKLKNGHESEYRSIKAPALIDLLIEQFSQPGLTRQKGLENIEKRFPKDFGAILGACSNTNFIVQLMYNQQLKNGACM